MLKESFKKWSLAMLYLSVTVNSLKLRFCNKLCEWRNSCDTSVFLNNHISCGLVCNISQPLSSVLERLAYIKTAHGGVCDVDDDCSTLYSTCFGNVCKCIPGYHYQEDDNTCLRECTHYGQSMTLYNGLGVAGHNNRILRGVASPHDCAIACVTEKTFLCLSFDYSASSLDCFLQDVAYLDVPHSARHTRSPYIYATRDCDAGLRP